MTSWAQTIAILVGIGTLTGMFWRAINLKLDALDTKLGGRIDALDTKLGGRIDALDTKLGGRIDALDTKLGGRIDALDTKLDTVEGRLESKIETVEGRLEDKIDAQAELMTAHLTPLQQDMALIKQHLLGHRPAA